MLQCLPLYTSFNLAIYKDHTDNCFEKSNCSIPLESICRDICKVSPHPPKRGKTASDPIQILKSAVN